MCHMRCFDLCWEQGYKDTCVSYEEEDTCVSYEVFRPVLGTTHLRKFLIFFIFHFGNSTPQGSLLTLPNTGRKPFLVGDSDLRAGDVAGRWRGDVTGHWRLGKRTCSRR